MNWPGAGNDPWYAANPTDGLNCRYFYPGSSGSTAVNYTPCFAVDGTVTSSSQTAISSALTNRRNTASPLWFDLRLGLTNRADSVLATLRVVSNTAYTTGSFRVRMILVEVHHHFATAAPNGQTDFDFPMISFSPSTSGQTFTHSGLTTDTVTYTGRFLVRTTGVAPVTVNNVGVVAWVRNETTREVLQSAYLQVPLNIPNLSYVSCSSTDLSGNRDGRIDPGETGSITVTLANALAYAPAPNTIARLRTNTPGITILDSVQSFGRIGTGGSASNAIPFRIQVATTARVQMDTFNLFVTSDTSNYSTNLTFVMRIGRPQLLLVQSDSIMDWAPFYSGTLQNLNIDFDKWDIDATPLPQAELLAYNKCIWFTGTKHNVILDAAQRAEFAAFIDAGKKMLFSSQNAVETLLPVDSNFVNNYLRATLVIPTWATNRLSSVVGDPYFDFSNNTNSLIRTFASGGAGDADDQTVVLPRGTHTVGLFLYDGRTDFGGVYYASGAARVAFLTFPLEAVSGAGGSIPRDSIVSRIMNFFDTPFSAPDHPTVSLPNQIELSEAFPNPFNPTTTVKLSLPASTSVNANVYDLSGRLILSVFQGKLTAGSHSFSIDISRQPSGLYFLRVEANGVTSTRKLALLR